MTIGDKDLIVEDLTVAEVALTFTHSFKEMSRYKLDFCCRGKKAFTEACRVSGVDPKTVLRNLAQSQDDKRTDNTENFAAWDVPSLINFIVHHHHRYVRGRIPVIKELLNQVCEVHGARSPFLFSIRQAFESLSKELLNHLPKEEKIVFPSILQMYKPKDVTSDLYFIKNYLSEPLNIVEEEHVHAGELIHSIRFHSDNYTPPSNACPTLKMTYAMLHQFDDNLIQHIHIENNILYPKAMAYCSQWHDANYFLNGNERIVSTLC